EELIEVRDRPMIRDRDDERNAPGRLRLPLDRGLDPEPPDRERRGRDVEERVTGAAVALVLALAPSRDESDRGFPELTVLCVLDPDPHRLASRITVRLEVEAGRFAAVRDCVSGVH